MAAVVGVRFKNAGKLYYFDPGDHWPMAGSFVIVETARGLEYGQVITGVREVDDELIVLPTKRMRAMQKKTRSSRRKPMPSVSARSTNISWR